MTKEPIPPTQAELEILKVLWKLGPQTVRRIWEEMGSRGGYTTTLKLLQIMFEKGLVTRDESRMTHVYEAAVAEKESQERLVGTMIDRLFDGSLNSLVLRALSAKKASASDLDALRALIDEARKKKGAK